MKKISLKIISFTIILSLFLIISNKDQTSNKDSSLNGIKIYDDSMQCNTSPSYLEDKSTKTQVTASSESSELNWYYVQREKNTIPEEPKESSSFLQENDGYYSDKSNNKVLYLTFDEGYEKGYTNDILDTLKEQNVPAAFFVVKPYIDSNPDIIKRMVNENHLVCNHSNHHPSMASITDVNEFNKEITDINDAYKDLIGEDMPQFFRPPMGKYSKKSLEMTKALGYKTIFWSFAYKDWLVDDQPSSSYALEKIKNSVHPGCIILLHAVSKTNASVLPDILSYLKNEGYEFKSLNDLPQ